MAMGPVTMGFGLVLWVALAALLFTACAAEPDGRELIRSMQRALLATREVGYSFRTSGAGSPAAAPSGLEGTAIIRRIDLTGSNFLVWVEGYGADNFLLVRGEEDVYLSSETDRTVRHSSLFAVGSSMLAKAEPALMYPFFDPNSLDEEIEALGVVWEGRSVVEGEPCDSIRIDYADDDEDARWCIGVDDHLPRKLEWINGDEVTALEIWDVDSSPGITESTFTLATPAGFELVEQPYGPARGEAAAPWSLATPSGTTVSLRELEGNVVILDFWASWCAPCVQSLKGLQELRGELAGSRVEIFAVNTMESGDPVKFLREQGIDLPLLLEGDELHLQYARGSIPAFVVLDARGHHFGMGIGYHGDGSKRYLRSLAKEALAASP